MFKKTSTVIVVILVSREQSHIVTVYRRAQLTDAILGPAQNSKLGLGSPEGDGLWCKSNINCLDLTYVFLAHLLPEGFELELDLITLSCDFGDDLILQVF